MLTKLIRIGNSQGIRIPKPMIQQAHLKEDVELEVRGESLILRPIHATREGWAEAARVCHEAGEDTLTDWEGVDSDFEGVWG